MRSQSRINDREKKGKGRVEGINALYVHAEGSSNQGINLTSQTHVARELLYCMVLWRCVCVKCM